MLNVLFSDLSNIEKTTDKNWYTTLKIPQSLDFELISKDIKDSKETTKRIHYNFNFTTRSIKKILILS